MSRRLAIFDCDGTLVDGQAHVCDTMEQAFIEAGLPPPDRNEVRRSVGLSLPVAIRKLAPEVDDALNAQLVHAYKQGFFARRQEGLIHEPLYDGIHDLLHRLASDGWLLAVATGKSERGLNACLAQHGLTELFVSLQTSDHHRSKPHTDMLEAALLEAGVAANAAVMIGDTTFDILMARDAGVRALGVAWGYHTPEELLQAGAEHIAGVPSDLEKLL
ncbi:HAD-IA family hydrolase [Altererythrobacter sp. BO-6]|uniref:HAD-IA family hydrolase n=1 Tax=Altererythrobacter sp. BO-6 TaxID=2604537 RepID=UPI0013E14097|nr:HAD-IA family hydrolase [Altererythrobacter sp. BO-6]QIG54812.1 HAD-IA family hydrolase [Altererythrobacter sp. BO-6]